MTYESHGPSPGRLIASFLALVALNLGAPSASAQTPNADALARAYELNEAGFEAFEEERFEDAARAFAEAWTHSKDGSLLKNESLAWFRAGRCDEAVTAGNKFLLSDTVSPSDQQDTHSVIVNCKVEFARRAIAARDLDLADSLLVEAETLDPDSLARDRVAATRVDLAAARTEAAVPVEPEIRTVYVAEPPPPVLEYSLIGAGGAIVVGSFIYQVVALGWQRKFMRMSDGRDEGDQATFDSLRKRVHLARALLPVLYTVGVGSAAVGGAMLFFVEPNEDGSATAWVGVRGNF